jgi:predicted ribosome quality control (RQC) complex YloA/Tae2 family protein
LYHYPPEQTNSKKLTMQEFEKIVTGTSMDAIVKCFAIELGLGGFYAEELCHKINVSKDKKRLSYDELHSAYRELMRLFNTPIKANVSGDEILPIENYENSLKQIENKKFKLSPKKKLNSQKNSFLINQNHSIVPQGSAGFF